jgi:phosphoglycerate dehydrogenase-like enzyme
MKPRIAIVNSSSFGVSFPRHLARLKRVGTVRRVRTGPKATGLALARAVRGCRAIVASVQPYYDAGFFRRTPDLVLLARHGIGVNNIDLEAATRCGVIVTKVPGVVEREAMAEETIALMLAVARKITGAYRAVAAGRWATRPDFVGRELGGRTIGLIGFGNIGSRVGCMLVRGFGARVLARDPGVPGARMRRVGVRPASLAAVLAQSDIISLHASLNPTSRGIISAAAIRKMRPGTLLVNTARGELVVERAVVKALRAGRLGGLATDVVADEPATGRHPFLRCPNTIVVPHIGAYTTESLGAMGDKMCADLEAVFVRRRRPSEVVNPAVWRSPALRFPPCP